jgi:cell division topological specificity factor
MGFFDDLFGHRSETSKEIAKERLQLVLIHDRTDLPPALMEQLRDELITVIAKYVDFDREDVEVKLQREARVNRLVADIPLRVSMRSRRR